MRGTEEEGGQNRLLLVFYQFIFSSSMTVVTENLGPLHLISQVLNLSMFQPSSLATVQIESDILLSWGFLEQRA